MPVRWRLFGWHPASLWKVMNVLADGGYTDAPFANPVKNDWAPR
jgi:hypothetical protein